MYVCMHPWAHIPHKPEHKDQVWPWPLIFNPTHAAVCPADPLSLSMSSQQHFTKPSLDTSFLSGDRREGVSNYLNLKNYRLKSLDV